MSQVQYDFAGKSAIVTGAAGGIGRATALAYAAAGASVAVVDLQREGGEETVAMIDRAGGKAIFLCSDVSDPQAVDAMVAETVKAFGRLDFGCNNAAVELEDGTLADVDDATARRVIDINFTGVFFCMRAQIRQMMAQGGGGAIVNVASMNAFRSRPTSAVYDGTKAAVLAMTRSSAMAYTRHGIRVNAVCPGVTDTPMLAHKMGLLNLKREQIEPVASLLHRFGQPSELAAAILWLSSDAASFVTGHALPVEGGFLLVSELRA